MKRFNKNRIFLSLLTCVIIPFVTPSSFVSEGMGVYTYGIPFSYISIYQQKPTSMWLGTNFFSGNAGISINPLTFLLSLIIIYFLINFVSQYFKNPTN